MSWGKQRKVKNFFGSNKKRELQKLIKMVTKMLPIFPTK